MRSSILLLALVMLAQPTLELSTVSQQSEHFASETTSELLFADIAPHQNISNLNSTNWSYGGLKKSQYDAQLFDLTTKHNITHCPQQTPFVQAGETSCSECSTAKPLFNLKTATCQPCPTGMAFSTSANNCTEAPIAPPKVPVVTPPVSSAPVVCSLNPCETGRYYNTKDSMCHTCPGSQYYSIQVRACLYCPPSTPFMVKNKCEACPPNTTINRASNSCR